MLSSGLALMVLSSSASASSRCPCAPQQGREQRRRVGVVRLAASAASASLRAPSTFALLQVDRRAHASRSADCGFFSSPGATVSSAWSGTPPNDHHAAEARARLHLVLVEREGVAVVVHRLLVVAERFGGLAEQRPAAASFGSICSALRNSTPRLGVVALGHELLAALEWLVLARLAAAAARSAATMARQQQRPRSPAPARLGRFMVWLPLCSASARRSN